MKLVVLPPVPTEQAVAFRDKWKEAFPDDKTAFLFGEDDVRVYDLTASRPCVVFGAKLVRTSTGWAARFGDLTAEGPTPGAAMLAFDAAFEGTGHDATPREADPAKMNAASARIQSLGCAVHIGERLVSPGVDPGLLIESPTLFRPRRVGSRPASAEKVTATDIRVTLSRAYVSVIDQALGDSTLIDGVMVTSFSGPERYAEAAEWLTNLHTHLGRH